MNWIHSIFGEGKDLEWYQVMATALAMFLLALIILRIGGMRIFSRKTGFDDIVTVMLGAILSRGITGAMPFFNALAGGAMIIIVHRVLSMLSIKSKTAEVLLKGTPVILYQHGKIMEENMSMCSLSESDLMESLRLETNKKSLTDVEMARMENNGSVSFILKDKR